MHYLVDSLKYEMLTKVQIFHAVSKDKPKCVHPSKCVKVQELDIQMKQI